MARAAAAIPIRPVLGALRLRNSLSNSLAALSNSQETISPVCQLEQVFHDLCSQYGIRTEVTVAVGTWGLGLHQSTRHVKAPTQSSMGGVDTSLCLPGISLMQQPSATSWASCSRQHQLLVAVPLHLVLSCSIPGCSPSPQETPVELRHLLYDTCCSKSWELQASTFCDLMALKVGKVGKGVQSAFPQCMTVDSYRSSAQCNRRLANWWCRLCLIHG